MNIFDDKKFLEIKVNPNKSKTKIISSEPFVMDVNAVPENNKANIEIIKFFKKKFKLNIKIKKGISSRKKLVEIIR